MRRFVSITSIVLILLSACSLPSGDCARADVFCVGLVTAYGTVDDHGLNQSAWEGVQQALNEKHVTRADFIETIDSRDRAKNIATFAEAGYDLIVTVGFAIGEDTRLAADQWPDTRFLGVDQPRQESRPNLAVITFPEDQGGFLAGALAGAVAQGGHVAALCEVETIPEMWRYCEGFRAGLQYVAPQVRARITYHPDHNPDDWFNDPAWGQDQARINLGIGMEVLFAAGGNTALGALEAASDGGMYVIGADEDLYYQVKTPEKVVNSVVKDVKTIVHTLVAAASQGQFVPGEFGGAYTLAGYHSLDTLIPPGVQARIEQIRAGLADGSIVTGVSRTP
jgi:basic membrane protein A